MDEITTYTAFCNHQRIAAGDFRTVLTGAKQYIDKEDPALLLIFEDQSGRQVDFDFSGTVEEVLERATPVRTGPGRPKLGVVSREVTLLPRHWEWLEQQSQGISGALRRLIDEARKRAPVAERARLVREATSKLMWSLAGDLPNFEEASRALFARDQVRFEELIGEWPKDVGDHVKQIAAPSFVNDDADAVIE